MKTSNPLSFLTQIKELAFDYAPKLFGAIIFYLIGSWLIRRVSRLVGKLLLARGHDKSLQTFLVSLINIGLNILLFLSVAGMIGINITAFGALIVGAGVALGSALNGTLGNFAGGVMLLLFKPFKVGDYIEAQGTTGTVREQGVFNTTIRTIEGKTVFVPNGPLSTGIITNATTNGYLRVDIVAKVSASNSIEHVRMVSLEAIRTHDKVLPTPSPEFHIRELGDVYVTLAICAYSRQPDYYAVLFEAPELIKKAWERSNISAPTPQIIVLGKAT